MSGDATDGAPAESVDPPRSSLAQAVIAVRQERDLLQSALAEERAAHAETALQLEAARAQLIEERELVRPASSCPLAPSLLRVCRRRRRLRAPYPISRTSRPRPRPAHLLPRRPCVSSRRQPRWRARCERATRSSSAALRFARTWHPRVRLGCQRCEMQSRSRSRALSKPRARWLPWAPSCSPAVARAWRLRQRLPSAWHRRHTPARSASLLSSVWHPTIWLRSHHSISLHSHFSHLVTAAAAAAASSELSLSEAVQSVQRPPPPPPPSPPIGASRLVGRRSISSGSLPALTGGDALLGLPAPQGWRPSTPTKPPSAARAGWVQFGEQVDAWTQPHSGAGAPPGWVTF